MTGQGKVKLFFETAKSFSESQPSEESALPAFNEHEVDFVNHLTSVLSRNNTISIDMLDENYLYSKNVFTI